MIIFLFVVAFVDGVPVLDPLNYKVSLEMNLWCNDITTDFTSENACSIYVRFINFNVSIFGINFGC